MSRRYHPTAKVASNQRTVASTACSFALTMTGATHAIGLISSSSNSVSSVPAASFTFEIMTSDALAHAPEIAMFMAPLKAAGVTFALSWFAGEELALSIAPRMGFTYLKLYGSLASNVAKDPKQQARLSGLVKRCRDMGLRTVCM